MSEYAKVKSGKLKLKGKKSISSKPKRTKKRRVDGQEASCSTVDNDAISHGNWWSVTKICEIRGAVSIELGIGTYAKAMDNGLFILGAPHDEGEGPDPEEILMAVPVGESRVAFKSGYGKYVGVDPQDRMVGRADAIGAMEQWEPVFQEGQMALMGPNGRFLSADATDDSIVVKARAAREPEMLHIRSNVERQVAREVNQDDGNLNKVELSYVKQFQKFQDKRIRLNDGGAVELKQARDAGKLHEKLLDRRAGMKADRYCK